MSNLGDYQVMTTLAKKVGGPKILVLICIGVGVVLDRVIVVSQKVHQYQDQEKRAEETALMYEVHTDGKSNEGLVFTVGDRFRILENDGDAVLIEKIGDKQNPYFVSGKFLASISDYKN